jgi:hypothetical protein
LVISTLSMLEKQLGVGFGSPLMTGDALAGVVAEL